MATFNILGLYRLTRVGNLLPISVDNDGILDSINPIVTIDGAECTTCNVTQQFLGFTENCNTSQGVSNWSPYINNEPACGTFSYVIHNVPTTGNVSVSFQIYVDQYGGTYNVYEENEYNELGEQEFCNKYFNGEKTAGMKLK